MVIWTVQCLYDLLILGMFLPYEEQASRLSRAVTHAPLCISPKLFRHSAHWLSLRGRNAKANRLSPKPFSTRSQPVSELFPYRTCAGLKRTLWALSPRRTRAHKDTNPGKRRSAPRRAQSRYGACVPRDARPFRPLAAADDIRRTPI